MLLQTLSATMAGAIPNPRFGLFAGSSDRRSTPLAPLAALLAPFGGWSARRDQPFARVQGRRHWRGNQGKPLALASALGELESAEKRIPMDVSPAMAPLAMVNPLSAFRGGLAAMFSTHPPIGERMARLEAIARGEKPADARN